LATIDLTCARTVSGEVPRSSTLVDCRQEVP
jgi:hypothetical protein